MSFNFSSTSALFALHVQLWYTVLVTVMCIKQYNNNMIVACIDFSFGQAKLQVDFSSGILFTDLVEIHTAITHRDSHTIHSISLRLLLQLL